MTAGGIAGGVIFKAACFDASVKNRSGAERGSGCICALDSSGLQISVFDLKQDRWMHIVAVGYRADELNFLSVLFSPSI